VTDFKKSWILFCVLCCAPLVLFLACVPPVSRLTRQECLKIPGRDRCYGPGEKDWVSFQDLSRHLVSAVTVAEDAKFWQHNGLDLAEILESARVNQLAGRYVRGGSTITQQVVKMAFLSPEKTLWRKVREAAGALLLERVLEKEEIFTWYMNLADFGPRGMNLQEAAKLYFDSEPDLLTVVESVQLALALPAPRRFSKVLELRRLDATSRLRLRTILAGLRHIDAISAQQWDQAMLLGDFGRPLNPVLTIADGSPP
jgi:monofunctional glycosyltransferase